MTIYKSDDSSRQIVPRLCTFNCSLALGEILPLDVASKPKVFTQKSYKKKEKDWDLSKNRLNAIDLVGTALILSDFDNVNAISAAKFLLNKNPTRSQREVAIKFLDNKANPQIESASSEEDCRQKISTLKQDLRKYSADATKWVDIAFFYTSIGQNRQALKSIRRALFLAPDHRFVLRSAARLFLHLENHLDGIDVMESLHFLRKSSLIKVDPWIISAEIAVSECLKTTAASTKQAKSILSSVDKGFFSVSELAGTMGTLEASHGANKKAKKNFKIALESPTENTLAQALWLKKRYLINIDVNNELYARHFNYEAKSRLFFEEENYKKSLDELVKWQSFQPFSSRPAARGSYIASVVLGDYKKGIEILERARIASPSDFVLANNLAFSHASRGEIEKAEKAYECSQSLSLTPRQQATAFATKGLIKFRKKDISAGRNNYLQSIQSFTEQNDLESAAVATYFLAREEDKAKTNQSEIIYKESFKLLKKFNRKEIMKLVPKKFHE